MKIYIENPASTKKLQEINKWSGNTKSVACLWANNPKKVLNNPLYSCIKKNEIAGRRLNKGMKDLYTENSKTVK